MNYFLGKSAYNAYCDSREWKSVKGEALPKFENQSPELQIAWQKAAETAVFSFLQATAEEQIKSLRI